MVSHLSTELPIYSLNMGERTGSLVLYNLWSYVKAETDCGHYIACLNCAARELWTTARLYMSLAGLILLVSSLVVGYCRRGRAWRVVRCWLGIWSERTRHWKSRHLLIVQQNTRDALKKTSAIENGIGKNTVAVPSLESEKRSTSRHFSPSRSGHATSARPKRSEPLTSTHWKRKSVMIEEGYVAITCRIRIRYRTEIMETPFCFEPRNNIHHISPSHSGFNSSPILILPIPQSIS